jgi:BirA family biotin operon repressor/biotin-[acetyl-CoA-carboxylase] ligase
VKLGERAISGGYRLDHCGEVGSTNDEAAALARSGDPGRVWVVADAQGKGRGRRGRAWSSPPGNLYSTLLLVDPGPMRIAPQLGFVAGVALHDAVGRATGLAPGRLRLKWPNDLLCDGAKLAGILVEGSSLPGAGQPPRFAAVIGIGVNLSHHPSETPYPATDLASLGIGCRPSDLLPLLADAMAFWVDAWASGVGFPALRRAWLERAGGLGEPILVRRPDGDRRGTFRDLDADGRLLLEERGITVPIEAGDVFLSGLAIPSG